MAYTVRLEPSGLQFDATQDQSLLRAAEAAGIPLSASCRNGTCRTCLAHVVRGQAQSMIEWPGLSLEEKAQGCILPCVYRAASDLVLRPGLPPN